MALTAHRKHKIYIAAIMGYGLGSGSDILEEVFFHNEIKEEIKHDKKNRQMGITRKD